jgi:hypothetical protein
MYRTGVFLRGVVNPHDFDGLLSHAIDRGMGRGRKENLSGSFLAPGPPASRPLFQLADSPVKLPHGGVAVVGWCSLR